MEWSLRPYVHDGVLLLARHVQHDLTSSRGGTTASCESALRWCHASQKWPKAHLNATKKTSRTGMTSWTTMMRCVPQRCPVPLQFTL